MSEVKRFDEYTCGVTEDEDGEYVKHSDYAKLAAEAQALREEVERCNRITVAMALDISAVGEALGIPGEEQEGGTGEFIDLIRELQKEVESLRARVVVVLEPVTMDGTTTIREYVANAVPKDTPMDKWTQGYEECKRRIHAMFEQPCNKRLNGKTVSEGLLRRLLDDGPRHETWVAQDELRALLNQDKENGNG
ncbi:hypothetical protein L5B81_21495 [Pseudomonas aeruginosa]|uniref:hypothetical protein n=1 Tax=Pseudomonas aeruginosa TaxID=287 RepID=UPI00192C8B35|nr:hypothetical protein [Pseudomonas aeruginosa]MBL4549735.1 hypothetical protein [Pseudomonas aeruginosa]MDG3603638.1 hypothetical protein [Pseudomonas aeruginosa]MDG3788625.1 hypothetical protein [Pseudomonas aeruginosa]MDG4118733.1 hypothetical protein [Pseudomonas aeruginosa]MDG4136010.1 hypothetical protein [Pseudomonas aeruginosa]